MENRPFHQIRVFAALLILAGLLCGLPLTAVAVKKVGILSVTFAVGLLLILIGYVGARIWFLARDLRAAPTPAP